MFPRRFPWITPRSRVGGSLAPRVPFGWVVRDIRTGRYWSDPYGIGKRAGDPRHDWRPRSRAYVFTTRRVADYVAHDRGVSDRVIVVPAGEYHQHTGGRVRPELTTDDGGDPLKRSGWVTPPPHPDTCTVQLTVRLVAGYNYQLVETPEIRFLKPATRTWLWPP